MEGISVIVCCYNSAKRLSKTLSFLLNQKTVSPVRWEIIIINNNSTDNTEEVAISILSEKETSIPYKIVLEKQPGLSHARRRGVYESSFENIIFCDDDNWLHPYYITKVFNKFDSDERIGAIGGYGVPVFEDNKEPGWFKQYQGAFACGKQGISSSFITKERSYLFGSGLAVRKSILLEIYRENLLKLSDRKGQSINSGGDSEICLYVALRGFELYYDEDLKYEHFIQSGRVTWAYIKKLYFGFGVSHYYLFPLQQRLLNETQSFNKFPLKRLREFWRKDWKNVLFFVFTEKEFSGMIKGAWLWGLTKEYLKGMLKWQS